MKISDLNQLLGLTVADYYYSCYKHSELGINPARSFNRKDSVQAYVLVSNTKENRDDSLYSGDETKLVEAFNALINLPKFFFIILIQNYKMDCVYLPDEVFLSEEEAVVQAKEELKRYKKVY